MFTTIEWFDTFFEKIKKWVTKDLFNDFDIFYHICFSTFCIFTQQNKFVLVLSQRLGERILSTVMIMMMMIVECNDNALLNYNTGTENQMPKDSPKNIQLYNIVLLTQTLFQNSDQVQFKYQFRA